MCWAVRTAADADGRTASTPSPVVFTTRPAPRPTAVRTASSCRFNTAAQRSSPAAAARSVDDTRSVKSTAHNERFGGGTLASPTRKSRDLGDERVDVGTDREVVVAGELDELRTVDRVARLVAPDRA